MNDEISPEMMEAGLAAMSNHWANYAEGDGRNHSAEMVAEIYQAMRKVAEDDDWGDLELQ